MKIEQYQDKKGTRGTLLNGIRDGLWYGTFGRSYAIDFRSAIRRDSYSMYRHDERRGRFFDGLRSSGLPGEKGFRLKSKKYGQTVDFD